MDVTDLARWQFGVTTVYHFLFVPLTIGLVFMVAAFETAWVRTGNEKWLKLTKFYGKLFLINFAMGLVTGIVQEFQFGMNWSEYSRFVGDVFGAPLAMEALVAFFLESTFLGLWIFGWDRLPKRIHAACIWVVAIGTVLSAYFILAANSWMQNPVGYRINPDTGRAELTDIVAVLTNKVALITVPHTVAGCFLVAGGLVTAVAVWHLVRRPGQDTGTYRSAVKIGAWTTLVAMGAMLLTGDIQGKIMTEVQPMKMAAAEALYESEQPAPFSVFTVGTLDGSRPVWSVEIPGLLSFLGTGSFDGRVEGINDLQAEYEQKYGAGDYSPNIPLTYWTFRFMIGLGAAAALLALWALWSIRRGRTPTNRWLVRALPLLPLLPLAANSTGWIFTEMGRQPWVVFGELKTAAANSPNVGAGELITSLAVFTVVYGVLAFIEVRLLLKYARAGLPDVTPPPMSESEEDRPLAFAY
ncbi:cytochrome ubiquinol oxidase subunit I [Catellatospora citrea]|uniref:Cytochrome ubiquinol oxidase subunit I n=1 Tax=Catellatospora citrea TaxID=53366 RepID=A0A8J3KDQ5_9ACTN|nr:cytochrome ubiquinol oxidase subunit I [Catellatospora citrea]RKE06764.1 cytochrome bd-I ubiquinol oxidase subunit 1 apoprotein [Catellatospora citrea]GIF94908.1 cytochrome ubiquinol oxidase subunit I [Catellatospora citrea]